MTVEVVLRPLQVVTIEDEACWLLCKLDAFFVVSEIVCRYLLSVEAMLALHYLAF